ncbi:hypothetical protein JKV55_03990 [Zobellella sp. CGMCC 1.18722]|uniref:Transposase n=1 Tax=Zobellella iuensis TaxID=2803811 RepID=A0ABS1QNR2_9GAMM|nr:hypothetical protein [Zobellella iuensis]
MDDLSILGDLVFEWPELKTLGIVAAMREVGGQAVGQGAAGREPFPLIDRIPTALATGWCMREDECPYVRNKRREQAGENMATIRHIAFNALKADTSFKAGMKRKQKRASRNNAYLSHVLAGLGVS